MKKIKKETPSLRAIKVRLYPNKAQKILLYKTFGCCRKIYNTLLDLKQKKLPCPTESSLKKEFEYLGEVDSIALQQSRMRLCNAFSNFFKSLKGERKGPKVNPPKFKSRKFSYQSFKTVNTNDNIKINFDDTKIKLPKIGWIRFNDNRIFTNKIRSITVSIDPSKRFYASIVIEKFVPEHKIDPFLALNKSIGFDMSLRHLTVDNDGFKTEYTQYFREFEEKLAWEQHKFSRMKKGSKRYNRQKIKVAKIHAKIADSRRDFLQKKSTQITNEYNIICIESLNMHAMAQSLSLGKSVMDVAWGEFTRMLEYKCLWFGKYLIKIPKYYPSSKLCSVCGYKYKGLTLSERTWVCPVCGTTHDRDINAAVNVEVEGIRIFKETYIHTQPDSNDSNKSTVGTTVTGEVRKDDAYARGDCVRPMRVQDCELACTGSGQ